MAAATIRILWGDERAGSLRRVSLPRWQCEVAAFVLCLALVAGLATLAQGRRSWAEQAATAQALSTEAASLGAKLNAADGARARLRSLMRENERSLNLLTAKQPAVVVDASLAATVPHGQAGEALGGRKAGGPDAADPQRRPPSSDHAVAAGNQDTATMWTRAQKQQADLARLLDYWQHAERRLRHTPAVRPVKVSWLSSSFGVRVDPISGALLMHKGLDLAGHIGMLVMAPADGVVIWVGERGGYGQTVVIDHGWGLQTHFAHLSKYVATVGLQVVRGQVVAEMGNTGKSTGPHLHYEVRLDGYPIDPRKFILD